MAEQYGAWRQAKTKRYRQDGFSREDIFQKVVMTAMREQAHAIQPTDCHNEDISNDYQDKGSSCLCVHLVCVGTVSKGDWVPFVRDF